MGNINFDFQICKSSFPLQEALYFLWANIFVSEYREIKNGDDFISAARVPVA